MRRITENFCKAEPANKPFDRLSVLSGVEALRGSLLYGTETFSLRFNINFDVKTLIGALLIFLTLSFYGDVTTYGYVEAETTTFEVVTCPKDVYQGKSYQLKISASDNIKSAEAYFFGSKIPLHRKDGLFSGVFGVDLDAKPGKRPIVIRLVDDMNEKNIFRQPVFVKISAFKKEYISLPPVKIELFDASLIEYDQKKITGAVTGETPSRYREGRFNVPMTGVHTSPFGAVRLYNGKIGDQHRGFDIAGPEGSQVRAANAGVVVLSEKLKVHGNTIIIDHGQGVFTLYCHLSKNLVESGERVFKGQLIGRCGNTGFSSGPHLHWGMSVHDVRVDPMQWTKKEF